jgi:hypothetical protein
VSQRYAAALGRDEDDFGFRREERGGVRKCGNEDGGANCASAVHAFLVGEGWFLKGLRGKIARCYDDNIKTCDFVRFEVVYESAASFRCCDVDARDICDVLRCSEAVCQYVESLYGGKEGRSMRRRRILTIRWSIRRSSSCEDVITGICRVGLDDASPEAARCANNENCGHFVGILKLRQYI